MTSKINPRFRKDFAALPLVVQKRARRAFRTFLANSQNPGLDFKALRTRDDLWSVRITDNYRAVGLRLQDSIVWFFIGTHAQYDALLAQFGR